MFRQILLIACLIALAIASDEVWFAIGERVDGDLNLFNQTTGSFETELEKTHTINFVFFGGQNTFTYARFDIDGDEFSHIYVYTLENGFNVTISLHNTTQLSAQATIYGFPPGLAPIDFKPRKITSKNFTMN